MRCPSVQKRTQWTAFVPRTRQFLDYKNTIKPRKIYSTEKAPAGKSFTATTKDWSEKKKPNQFTEFWRPIRTAVPVPSTGDWCPSRCDMEAAPSALLSWAVQHWHCLAATSTRGNGGGASRFCGPTLIQNMLPQMARAASSDTAGI